MDPLSTKIIGSLVAMLLSVVAYEAHRLRGELVKVARRQKHQENVQKEFIRTMFNLLAQLYPDQAKVITYEMQRFFLKNDVDYDVEFSNT